MSDFTDIENQIQDMQQQLAAANEDVQNQLEKVFSLRKSSKNQSRTAEYVTYISC